MVTAEHITQPRGPSVIAGVSDKLSGTLPWPALVYLLCVVIPIWFNAGPLNMSILRLFLLVMIIPMMIQLFSGRYGKILVTDVLMVLHVFWMGLSLWINSPSQMVTQIGSVGLEFLGGYLVARASIRSRESFVALCRWVVGLVIVLLPFALIETQTGSPPLVQAIRAIPGINSIPIVHQDPRMNLERVQAVFVHPIHFGLFCSVSVSLTFVAMRGILSTQTRWVLTLLSGLAGFLALSSGALLAISLQIALIGWAVAFANFKHRWLLLLGLFALAWIAIDILSTRSPMRVFMSYATFSAHNAYWRAIIFEWGMKSVWNYPYIGIGLNDWVRPDFMLSGSMDNFWLVMAVRFGIPGFLFVAVGYAWMVFLIMRRKFGDDQVLNNMRIAWVFTFLGLSFTLATVHVWASIYSFVFFMLGAGAWLIHATPVDGDAEADLEAQTADQAPSRFSRFQAGRQNKAPLTRTAAQNPRVTGTDTAPARQRRTEQKLRR